MDTFPSIPTLLASSCGPAIQLLLLQMLNQTSTTRYSFENKAPNYESREVHFENKLHTSYRTKRSDKDDTIRQLISENFRLKKELLQKEEKIAELEQSVEPHISASSGGRSLETTPLKNDDDDESGRIRNTAIFSEMADDLVRRNQNTTLFVSNLKEDLIIRKVNVSEIIQYMNVIEHSLNLQSNLIRNLSLTMATWFKSVNNMSDCSKQRYTCKRSLDNQGMNILQQKAISDEREKLKEELIAARKHNALLYSYYKFEDKLTGLLRACVKCDLPDVKLLIEQGASLSEKDDSGNTGVHLAAREGCESVVDWIITNSSFIDIPNMMWATPLHVCAKFNQLKVARLLINRNATIEAKTKDYRTPLHFAVQHGHLQMTRLLLDSGADIEASSPSHGTPLHAAALHSQTIILKALLDSGADVNSICRLGTPLHFAIKGGNLKTVQELLDYGATVDALTEKKMSPLHTAAEYGRMDIARLLIERDAEIEAKMDGMLTPLHLSARNGTLQVAELLLNSGAEVDAKSEEGLTPLYVAAENGHLLVGRLLLDRGARLAALPHARFSEFLVDVLYGRGVLDLTQENKERLLVVAARQGNLTLARLLIEVGTYVSPRYEYGFTPLHWAATRGYVELAKALLEAGADIEKVDLHFFTPLNRAAWNGRLEVCKLLIDEGADMGSRTIKNHTPLHGAAMQGHLQVVQLLVEKGADLLAMNAFGRTPLEEAIINKQNNVVMWLRQEQSGHLSTVTSGVSFENKLMKFHYTDT